MWIGVLKTKYSEGDASEFIPSVEWLGLLYIPQARCLIYEVVHKV
jgi:hypothetical protein